MELVHLSGREAETAQLLADGLLVKQAAYELGISEKTTRQYVQSIKRKFSASTLSDAITKYLNQKYNYSDEGLAHDFYIRRAVVGIELLENERDAFFSSDLSMIALKMKSARLEGSFGCDGTIGEITSFGKTIEPTRRERGRIFFENNYAKDVSRGDTIERNLRIFMSDVFVEKENYWSLEQTTPCRELVFFVKYQTSSKLKFSAHREYGSSKTDLAMSSNMEQRDNIFIWTISNPPLFAFHTIRWSSLDK